jgi:hypothetical protein
LRRRSSLKPTRPHEDCSSLSPGPRAIAGPGSFSDWLLPRSRLRARSLVTRGWGRAPRLSPERSRTGVSAAPRETSPARISAGEEPRRWHDPFPGAAERATGSALGACSFRFPGPSGPLPADTKGREADPRPQIRRFALAVRVVPFEFVPGSRVLAFFAPLVGGQRVALAVPPGASVAVWMPVPAGAV